MLSTQRYAPDDGDQPMVPDHVMESLSELAAGGRDHLCVIGDHRLQAAPWNLYPTEDRLLSSAAALGKEPLEDAADEARAVAAAMGGTALVDGQATESALRELAPTARYLHIATHGDVDLEAPGFHSLLLSPKGEDDGHLAAWEVAALDLRMVRLVTLSACDSARIVVTSGDNVDGLPLAFLAAGARAVIGTQQEIRTAVSRFFFEQLYRSLAVTDDLRDAYRSAQRATRERFPDPDDWASFYLLGDWR